MIKNSFAFLLLFVLAQSSVDAQFRGGPRPGGRPNGGGGPRRDDQRSNGEGGPRPVAGPRFNATITDLDCSVSPTDPVCPEDRNGEVGIWVCRQGIDRETRNMTSFSTCTSANRTLSIDTCGCCGESCPELCKCPCELGATGEQNGVSVIVERRDNTTETRCMDPRRALRKTVRGDRFTCDTSCVMV